MYHLSDQGSGVPALEVVSRNTGTAATFSHVTPRVRAGPLLFYSEGVFLLKLCSSYKAKPRIMPYLGNKGR